MTETHPIWFVLYLVALVPLAIVIELVAAVVSRLVRAFIVGHPIAHLILFGFAILCLLLLIPAPSGVHRAF